MSYQFAHIYTYSGSGGKEGKFTVSGCLGEAFRDDGFTSHIENPEKNVGLAFGRREVIEAAIKKYQDEFRDGRGHKLRKDGKCLLAGVFSWPPDTEKKDFTSGNEELKKWLQKEYGSALRCVLFHEDEPFQRGKGKGQTHYHSHFFIVPDSDQNMKDLHPGLRAKAEARAAGGNIIAQDEAYKRAMGDWQDKINKELGSKLGLGRERPAELKEKRLSRREQKILEYAETKAQDEGKKIKDEALNMAKGIIADAERAAAGIRSGAEKEIAGLNKKAAELKKQKEAQDERETEFFRGRDTALSKWEMPGVAEGEYKKLPLLGEFFSANYFDRVQAWAVGLVKRVQTLMSENKETKKELEKDKEEMRTVLMRLDGKYGQAKEFEEWKKQRDKERVKKPETGRGR